MEQNETTSMPTVNTTEGGEGKLTFDELLAQNKEYQAEFDRRLAKSNETSIKNAHEKWEKEKELERSEAQKLAKMDTEEKYKYELDKLQKELDSEKARNNAHALRETVTKIAEEKGIGSSLLGIFDYERETAESMDAKIKTLATEFDKCVEQAVNERLKEKSPKQVSSQVNIDDKKDYFDKKYGKNPFYKK